MSDGSCWRVFTGELTYDLFFQKEHCVSIVFEDGLANESRGREASYGAVELNLQERCCSNRGGGEQWLDMGSILNIDPIELSIDKEWTLR